jgi:diguanylate cyclase (GGDEF)-like protein
VHAARVPLWRDPVLFGLAVSSLAALGWYLAWPADPRTKLIVFWPLIVVTDVVMIALTVRLVWMPELHRYRRRFWIGLAAAVTLFALGDGVQMVITWGRMTPGAVNGGQVQSIFLVAGIAANVANMLIYPSGNDSAGARLRFWLDSATVMVASAVLAVAVLGSGGGGDIDATTGVVTVALVLVTGFSAIRVTLAAVPPATRGAAVPLVTASLMQGLGAFIAPVDSSATTVGSATLAVRLFPSLIFLFGPRIQELRQRADPTALITLRDKPYRLMPYVAVLVTFGTMIVTLPDGLDRHVWGAIGGAVMVTAIVVIRQVLAFRDNFRLIDRLDAALLEVRDKEGRLREQALHDGLTELFNRTAFVDAVADALTGRAPDERLYLLLIDLDDFKAVNDTLGHAAGDAMLIAVARRLREATRDGDVVARLGGDEFAVLLRGRAAGGDGTGFAAEILAAVSRPVRVGGSEIMTRASVGVAPADDEDTLDELIRKADIAMYAAKDGGKGGYAAYNPNMTARILETARLTSLLREAIGADEFHLLYQPIVTLPDGRLVGVEALVRWHSPVRGPLSPMQFIPIAEQTGLIVPLGRWILREACRQAVEWRAAYPQARALRLNVNVSGRQLQEQGFADDVAAVLAETGMPAELLTIEVTESGVLSDAPTIATLHALRAQGIGLALDDFGTAASSLGLLLTCPVDALKLDRSFVDRVTTVARQSTVATAVIQMARSLELTAVAEGIETAEQAAFLHGLGYRLGQGFLFARPLAPAALAHTWTHEGITV